jgi:cell division septation protein DedD
MAVLAALAPASSAAQQGTVHVTAAAQAVQGDPRRIAGQTPLDPDFGVTWLQPGTRFGLIQAEVRGTRRDNQPHLGKTFFTIRDWKFRNAVWTIDAGDSFFSPSIGDYRFANLSTPALTFAGASVMRRTSRSSAGVLVGRTTFWRNLFGTDADTLDQDLVLARVSHAVGERLELSSRGSHVRTGELPTFGQTIAVSDQGGVAARWIVSPALHVVGDGSIVSYRRTGTDSRELDGSGVAGASVLLARGWFHFNVARFSPGELPIVNQALNDRQTAFAAGELDAFARLRVFGGWEAFRTNLDPQLPQSGSRSTPASDGTRGFGGVRTPVGPRSSVAFRIERGDRRSRTLDAGLNTISDTGVITAEWQSTFGAVSGVTRYSRRENVESTSLAGSHTVHDASGHLFLTVSPTTQVFGNVVATETAALDGTGSTFWQAGGGVQSQLLHRSLWVRAEGSVSRDADLLNTFAIPQRSINVGLNGEIARNTILGFNVFADRISATTQGEASWISRTSVRLTRSFQTGSPRSSHSILGNMARHSGTGSIGGIVFSDWNANGQQDQDEKLLENIPVRLANLGTSTTSRSGEFAFINVPVGLQQVGIDPSALPVDFDVPSIADVQVQLGRGESKRVAFGLVPLGSVSGTVVIDANRNGVAEAGEPPVDGAVLVLDGGARSEQVRKGRFKFDAVRSGDHIIALLPESLPDGATVHNSPEIPVALTRTQPDAQIGFLVTISARPEQRKVFPAAPSPGGASGQPPKRSAATPAAIPPARSETSPTGKFAVQIVALNDPFRARDAVSELKAMGFAAYLVEPPPSDPDAPYRVRVGRYATRTEAEAVAESLEKIRKQKLWVISER